MNYLKYILPFLISTLAIIHLIKDWKEIKYSKYSYLRFAALVLIIIIAICDSLNSYLSDDNSERQHQQDNVQITKLQQALETSETHRKNDTKLFLSEFNRLSEKVSSMESRATTAELKKKFADLQSELENTRKALVAPKANLTFTFPKPYNDAPTVRTATLPVKDNVVHVDFAIVNNTDVPALDGELAVHICKSCEFASESNNFKKIPGGDEDKRFMKFDRILQKAILRNLSVDIKVPPSMKGMQFGITYRCQNCIVPDEKENIGTIQLSR